VNALGFQSSSDASFSSDEGFNSAYLLPVYKVMEKGLDKYSDWALDTVSWGKISGKAFQTAGKVAGLALIAVQSAVDLSTAITTIVSQEEAKKQYAQLVPDAQQPVSMHAMLKSGKDEDLQQLLLFWALLSSPYKSGAKAGEGQLNDATLCADPTIGPRCKYSAAVVEAAGNAVQVWQAAAVAPAPAEQVYTVAGIKNPDEARVISVDPTTFTVRARLVDYAKVVVIRVGDPSMLNGVTVGQTIYVDIATKAVSLDGKTKCCIFMYDTQGVVKPLP
jgi:hypothetical protein